MKINVFEQKSRIKKKGTLPEDENLFENRAQASQTFDSEKLNIRDRKMMYSKVVDQHTVKDKDGESMRKKVSVYFNFRYGLNRVNKLGSNLVGDDKTDSCRGKCSRIDRVLVKNDPDIIKIDIKTP